MAGIAKRHGSVLFTKVSTGAVVALVGSDHVDAVVLPYFRETKAASKAVRRNIPVGSTPLRQWTFLRGGMQGACADQCSVTEVALRYSRKVAHVGYPTRPFAPRSYRRRVTVVAECNVKPRTLATSRAADTGWPHHRQRQRGSRRRLRPHQDSRLPPRRPRRLRARTARRTPRAARTPFVRHHRADQNSIQPTTSTSVGEPAACEHLRSTDGTDHPTPWRSAPARSDDTAPPPTRLPTESPPTGDRSGPLRARWHLVIDATTQNGLSRSGQPSLTGVIVSRDNDGAVQIGPAD